MFTSHVDHVVSDDDKAEALQALMKVLNVDVISHIFSGCSCDTQIHTHRGTGFQKKTHKATEIKLLVQSTLNPNSFVEITMTFFTKNSVMLKKRNTWEVQNRDGSILDFARESQKEVSAGT